MAEKAKLSPSLNLGVNSMTMKGNGADEKYYNATHRFQSGFVGVGIPVFNSAQKSVIEAQKVNQLIAENNYQLGLINLKNLCTQRNLWDIRKNKLPHSSDDKCRAILRWGTNITFFKKLIGVTTYNIVETQSW